MPNTNTLRSVLTLCLLAPLGCTVLSGGSDDEAGDVDDTPDGAANFGIAFPDARVIYYGTPEKPYGEIEFDGLGNPKGFPREQPNWAPFLPSSPPNGNRPAFPYPRGVPDVWPSIDAASKMTSMNKLYTLTLGGAAAYGVQAANPRSGLVGNLALALYYDDDLLRWLPLKGTHPRPPMFSQMYLNPLDMGRINAGGIPCRDNRYEAWNVVSKPGDPLENLPGHTHDDCKHFVWENSPAPIAPQWPMELAPIPNNQPPVGEWESGEAARCLTNGGEHDLFSAVEAAFVENDGLIWFNIGELEENAEDIAEWAGDATGWDDAQVILDWLLQYGLIQGYTWPHFSTTGVCAFSARLAVIDVVQTESGTVPSLVTRHGCPNGHYPVLPSFNVDALALGDEIDGYCAVPFAGTPLPNATEVPLAVLPPEAMSDVPWMHDDYPNGERFRMYTLDFDVLDVATLLAWRSAVELEPTTKGVVVRPAEDATGDTSTGDDVLALFGLQAGDLIVSLDSDLDLRRADDDVIDNAFARVDASLSKGHHVTLWVQRQDSDGSTLWLPTYLRGLGPN